MSEVTPTEYGSRGPSRGPVRLYILVAAILVVIIVVAAVLLLTRGLPGLLGGDDPTSTATVQPTATLLATFTPRPTQPPTATAEPTAEPTAAAPQMAVPETPLYVFQGAGARPGADWTGFFGTVQDASGAPVAGVPLIVWYPEGTPASAVVETDQDGYYEIRLADVPHSGTWTLQVLTEDGQPASELVTFQTDENTETGIQQIQVLWQQVP
ncbi:MAG: carboxypeptidase regulatory-like domain-containing protein [Anaerolineaceae bacterium]|nr:carboxypeptidase regulatory-like domain-containing protein [Anaerolineaceae bacterium]